MMLQNCRLQPELWMKESVNGNEGKINIGTGAGT
jgi:hypothetical protein